MKVRSNPQTTQNKDFIAEIHQLCEYVEEALSALYKAFLYHKVEFLQEAEPYIMPLQEREQALSEKLLLMSDTDKLAMRYAPVPINLARIGDNLKHISKAIGTKIREGLLFSDKAVSEMNYLFYRLKEIVTALEDLVLARNTYLANYIKESEREIERVATEYATAHEERLIEGICMQKSSGIYLVILDSIKRIAWNIKEIAQHITRG